MGISKERSAVMNAARISPNIAVAATPSSVGSSSGFVSEFCSGSPWILILILLCASPPRRGGEKEG